MNETMTPKERWLAVLTGATPDRLPMDYWGTEEATRKLRQHLGCTTMWQLFDRLHIDRVFTVRPRYIGPPLPRNHDIYGMRYRRIRYGEGVYRECISHPLAGFETV